MTTSVVKSSEKYESILLGFGITVLSELFAFGIRVSLGSI